MPTRRTFLVAGALGAAALGAAGWFAALLRRPKGDGALAGDARVIVRAIVPAMLGDALPSHPLQRSRAIAETVDAVERAIAGLSPSARHEIGELFALLSITPARRAFAGVASPWESAGPDEVGAFLDRFRDSGWALKRSAYDALHQLVFAAWYGNPLAWPAIGYPGPPSLGG